jgi:hypothetical protein
MIEWSRTAPARHVACPVAPAAGHAAMMVENGLVAAPVVEEKKVDLSKVAIFLSGAMANGLIAPKVRFVAPGGGELRLAMAGSTSKFPGAVQVKINGAWVGRVQADGVARGPMVDRPAIIEALAVVGNDPAKAAKEFAALTCRCSFCNLHLTDEGSVEVGYGPVCAKKYNLPHQPKGAKAVGVAA